MTRATRAVPERSVYFPNIEDLAPYEMRIIACGSGMPSARESYARQRRASLRSWEMATSFSSTEAPAWTLASEIAGRAGRLPPSGGALEVHELD